MPRCRGVLTTAWIRGPEYMAKILCVLWVLILFGVILPIAISIH